jgi:hypothetical protein
MQTQPDAPVVSGNRLAARRAAFGLTLEVDPRIEIPGVPELDTSPPLSGISTCVKLDPKELHRRWSLVEHTSTRVREQRDGGAVLLCVDFVPTTGYLLSAPAVGRILISPDGTELLCDPKPGCPEWTTLIPAQALPLAATLRGFEVLHASGVVLGGRAALFTGPPGAGKSSLAAALLRLGATLLSDDTVALETRDGALVAHPGAALLHLRAAEHDRLSTRERSVLGPPVAFPGKQRYVPSVIASEAPFGKLFLLDRSTHGNPVERVEAVDPLVLLASTFNLSVRTPERLTRHLDLAADLAASGHIYRLRIRPEIDATRLAETLHEYLAIS